MSSATVKRARVTARIAEAESTSLPTSSEVTQKLLEQTEGKRKQLDKKCSEYEQICKKVTKLRVEKNRIQADHAHLLAQADEVDQAFTKLEQSAEASFLLQQQKNNEMKEAVQQWTVLDGKEKKLHDDLAHEIKIEKELRETCDEVSRSVDNLSTKADNNEKERIQLENAFDADLKTEKTLEQYLTRLIDDVFINQRRLEDIRMGTSRGRVNFRQAEKALREQKRRHRKLSSQISESTIAEDNVFQPEKTEEERKELEKMEDAWDSLQEKIRLKEFELTDETEKINEKIRVLEEQRLPTLKQEEKQKQLKIANDYAALQSLTPMYAAYTANLNLNQNLMERLDVSKERKSTLPEKSFKTKPGSSEKSVEFMDELDDFSYYNEMLDNRKKNEAIRILHLESKELEGVVSGQRQEANSMDRDVKWLKEQIELRQADILFYSTKTDELIEKAKKEEAHKLHSTTPHKSQKELADKDLTMTSAAREDVLEMTEKRIILENERSMITNQIRECSLECDRLNDQWKILKGFAKSINVDSIRVMNDEIEQWKLKVGQLNNQIDKLQKMEDYASLANSQLRTNLAVLKPYDKEYQEFESLVESNKQLNDQLAKHEFKQKVEELKYSRDIQFVP